MDQTTSAEQRARAGRLRDNPAFRRFWAAEAVSTTGTAVAAVALPLTAVAVLDAGPLAVGVLEAATWVPWLAVGLVAGAVVDRLPPRQVMVGCDLAAALVFGLVPVAALLGHLSMAVLVAAALTAGVVDVLSQAARQTYPPLVVPDAHLEAANSSLQASESVTELAGAPLAGLVTHVFGALTGVASNAVSFVVSASLLWCGPAPAGSPRRAHALDRSGQDDGDRVHGPSSCRARTPAAELRGVLDDVHAGLRFVLADRWLRASASAAAVANFALTGIGALQALLLLREVGVAPSWYGPLLVAEGAGGLLGAVAGPRLAARVGACRAVVVLAVVGPVAGALIVFTAPGWSLAFFVVGGLVSTAATVGGNVVWAVFRQRYIPPHLLGRASAAVRVIACAAAPLGALVAGGLAAATGVRAAIAVLFACALVRGLLFLRRPWRTARDLPAPVR